MSVLRPATLRGRFTLFLILPVTAILFVMGLVGFFYARDLLLDQWREAAILKLQRAAHQMDMHLVAIKEGIRLFHETPGARYDESYHAWALDRITHQLKERLRLKEAMDLAVEVQQNLLPASPPSVPGLDIAGRSLYCQETGGDYFDYIFRPGATGRPRWCVAVGDVVGHGISAALLMTTVRALLRSRLDQAGPMAAAVGDVNRLLCRDTASSGGFVTLFLLEVNPATGGLEWVRAGHDPALMYRAAADDFLEAERSRWRTISPF